MTKYLVVGAGFSGAVLARELAESGSCCVLVIDERKHLGGNCHTERDPQTGVMLHRYGPHIFNTDNEKVWKYVNHHGNFRPFINRVKAHTARGIFSMPINLLTLNQFFGRTMNPFEARDFVTSLGNPGIGEPQNFEEQALKSLGRDLYETFFKGYTIKQWGCDPKDLPASVLKRLPIRFSYDDNYYDKKYQGIPAEGYTEVIRKILDHPNIEVRLGEKFDPSVYPSLGPTTRHASSNPLQPHSPSRIQNPKSRIAPFSHLFYTGPIDAFFGYREGRLGYRTVTFERIPTNASDYQGNAVINYPELDVPYTRIHEHKHFAPWESHEKTAAFREFSKETCSCDIPYYPKRLASDKILLQKYRNLAESFSLSNFSFSISFLGRLATYRYMDMEKVIAEALDFSQTFLRGIRDKKTPPVFPNQELDA